MPDEIPAKDEARDQALIDFGRIVADKRDAAVKWRKESCIEELWTYCEEAYVGIDEANRHEFSGGWIKPPTMSGGLILRQRGNDDSKSTAFVLLTARYVDAGAAKIGEITQPVDGPPFKMDPTPVPDLISGQKDERQIVDNGVQMMRPAANDEAVAADPTQAPQDPTQAPQSPPQVPPQVPLTVKDLARARMDEATTAAKKASERIYDWLTECKHPAQMRKVTFDGARLGVGVLKGPIPSISKAKSVRIVDGNAVIDVEQKTVPITKWINPWNFFPAEDCGENIHDGGYVVERDLISQSALRKLADEPGYLEEAIELVIKQGPDKCNDSRGGIDIELSKKSYKVWYFYGEIDRSEFDAANPEQSEKLPEAQESVFAIVTLVNDTVIRATINPMDSGRFPYHVFCWRRRPGHWAGKGVAEQVKLAQVSVNGATRALFNNAGLSAGSLIVMDRGAITPAVSGDWRILPNSLWFKSPESTMDDVRKAFATFQIPNMTPQMMSVIELGFKFAEESSSIPLITQGQSGSTTPDTFGATQLQNNNANQLLRDVGHAVADGITNPLIEQMYEWLLLDPDIPAEEKGDFKVNTNAAAAMIERAVQDRTIIQMGQMVLNPAFGADPKKWFAMMLRANRLDPRDVQYTEEEMAAQEKNQSPPLPLAVAQIRAASAEKIAAGRDQVTVQKSQLDTDRDNAYQQSLNERAKISSDANERELAMKRELEVFKENNSLKKELDKLKAELAISTQKLATTKELAYADMAAGDGNNVIGKPDPTPAIEIPGKAEPGQSFAQ